MNKILFNTWSGAFLKPGGGEVQLLNSKSALEKLGYNIQLYNNWIPQTDFDILHQFSVVEGVEHIVRNYKDLGKKVVVAPILWHNFDTQNPVYTRIQSILTSADLLFTNSNEESKRLHKQFSIPMEKFHKTRNSISREYYLAASSALFQKSFSIKDDFVLSVANIDSRKNTELLIKACKELDIPIVTIGHVRDVDYFNVFKGTYSKWLHLGPVVDVELLKSAYAACRVFALPSLCETPGLAALEAASQGANIVITNEGPTKEYFGNMAIYVDPLNFESIKQGILQAWEAPRKHDKFATFVRDNYSWDYTALDIVDGYKKLAFHEASKKASATEIINMTSTNPLDLAFLTEAKSFLYSLGRSVTHVFSTENDEMFYLLGEYLHVKSWKDLEKNTELMDWLNQTTTVSINKYNFSRLELCIYLVRQDLRDAFPLPEKLLEYKDWVVNGFLRERRASVTPTFKILPSDNHVNLIGLHKNETGLANVLRSVKTAIDGSYNTNVLDIDLSRAGIITESFDLYDDVSICFMPPSEITKCEVVLGAGFLKAKRNISFIAWETSNISEVYKQYLTMFDEIWCYSKFIQEAVLNLLPNKTVKVVPLFVDEPSLKTHNRDMFGLTEEQFVFGFHFDFNSSMYRKNPLGLVKAFQLAFPKEDSFFGRVKLVIKIHNVVDEATAYKEFISVVEQDSRIQIVREFWERSKVYDWVSNLDVYASLHRSEGFGYGMAEAMVRGVPTLATGYSGNMQFMNEKNSMLVDYKVVPVNHGEYFVGDDQFWAEPNIEDAARKMKILFTDSAKRKSLAHQGKEDVDRELSYAKFHKNVNEFLHSMNARTK